MKTISAAILFVYLIVSATAQAQTNQSISAKLDTIMTKLTNLQTSVDALKPPPPKSTTSMLFPFAINQVGFDTAITLANTLNVDGTCTVNFFGTAAPSPMTTPTITAGTVYAFTISATAPGFQGYLLVDCNFPRARGWGFVSDLGAHNLATTVEAEILP
jgi:hypothetical protein